MMRSTSVLLILFTAAVFLSSVAAASDLDTFDCGGSHIEILNSDDVKNPNFEVNVSRKRKHLVLRFSVTKEFMFVRCEPAQNKYFLLVNNFCGGSGCGEYNYGIVEAKSMKIMLSPNKSLDSNVGRARKVLGREIKPFACIKPSKTSQGYQPNGEYCYVSPLELG